MIDLSSHRILVTGAAGFLGRHVLAELRATGVHDDHILAPRRSEYDLTRPGDVERMYADLKPSIVIHLAAEVGGIGANRQNPGRFFYANMAMGLNLIEGARHAGIAKFVQIGTVCSYPKFAAVPFKETDLWNGYPEETNAPYGIAKKALLVMLQGYRQQYGLNGIFLMPVNLYGPHDDFDLSSSHVIPALISKFIEARDRNQPSITVWGSGKVSREFLYVEDCARGIVLATRCYDEPEPVNLGAGFEITIAELAEKIRQLTGFKGNLRWDTSMPDGQPRRRLDTSLAWDRFQFQHAVGLEEGLQRTIQWYESQRTRPR